METKLVIGCGRKKYDGWINTGIKEINLLDKTTFDEFGVTKNSLTHILAEHVWEHLTYEEGILAAKNCKEYLKDNGRLRIAVPDGFHPDYKYINSVKPGGTGLSAKQHKILYNYRLLLDVFIDAGFYSFDLLEFWDEKKEFHFMLWKPEDGFIKRSKRFDSRNKIKQLSYTSLIIDVFKEKK